MKEQWRGSAVGKARKTGRRRTEEGEGDTRRARGGCLFAGGTRLWQADSAAERRGDLRPGV